MIETLVGDQPMDNRELAKGIRQSFLDGAGRNPHLPWIGIGALSSVVLLRLLGGAAIYTAAIRRAA